MYASLRIAGAPSSRGEAHPVAASELADRFRHDCGAAFLPARGHGDVAIIEGIERRQIALARHAEHVAHAVRDQLVDQNLAAAARDVLGTHVVTCWRLSASSSHTYRPA